MEKRGVVIVLILILSHIAIAQEENYNQYTSLLMNVKVSTTLDVVKTSSKGTIEYLQAELELFPRTTPEQEIMSQYTRADPEASIKKGDRDIIIEWGGTDEDSISYSVESDVRTYNKIRKISKKTDFPIWKLDPELEVYTKPTEYIDINTEIREKAAEIAEGETDLYIVNYKLGEWVRKNIRYDLNTLTASVVQKSSWVLTNKEGVCDEITNLFISMARSLGIPARFVSGVVYSNTAHDFENHGWAEIYLPDYGWMPFDITFGQYGWIDPSHVKMDESLDSGEPAVTYNWRAKNAEISVEPLKINTKINLKEGTTPKLAQLEIRPIEQDVGFGSYMILEVTAENLQGYYLPLTFALTKSPELVQKDPSAHTLLKPKEKKKFYWTLKIPDDLDKDYIYTTEIEAESNFAEKAKTKIRYGQGFKKYTREWAAQTYEMLAEREQKIMFRHIELNCVTDKEHYLSTQNAKIKCIIRNTGNTNMGKVNVCAREKCKEISLRIAEEKEVPFEIELKKTESLTITAETEKYIKEQTIILNVKEIPEINIINYEPEIIDHDELTNLALKLFTKTKAKNVILEIENVGNIKIDEFEGIYVVNIPVKGKQFRKGFMEIKISYKSEIGETFIKQEKLGITVTNLPWYARLLNFLGF